MADDDMTETATHLSWRDVYTAVGQMEERMTKVLERIEAKFDNVSGDHETRIRALETNGSAEAREALRIANAIGNKLDTIKTRVDAYDNRERGIFGTLRSGQSLLLLFFALLGALSAFLHVLGVI